MRVCVVLCFLGVLPIGRMKELQDQDRPAYVLTRIEHNPGLYFEKINQIRLIQKYWHLTVTVDLHSLIGKELPALGVMERTYRDCVNQETPVVCRDALHREIIKDYAQEFWSLQRHLANVLKNPDSVRSGRLGRAPLLGFVGTISRKLFGTMDYNDHEHLTKEIDRLFNDQRQITHLLSNSTHLIQAEMNVMKKSHEKNVKNLETLETQIKQVLNNDIKTKEFIASMEYLSRVKKIGDDAEHAARKYLEGAHKLIEALEDAKHGRISPLLLSRNLTMNVITEIEKLNTDCVFPLSREKLDLAVLSQISQVSTGVNNGRFLATITIPLLSRDQMELYRMIPCKSRQNLEKKGIAAFIQPSAKYLMVSRLTSRYSLIEEDFLKRCILLENCLACQKTIPLRKAQEADCCKVLLTSNLQNSWSELTNGNGWLYSVLKPENLMVTCLNGFSEMIRMEGTGIFNLRSNCTAESATIFLEGSSDVDSQLPMISGAPTTINISEISPVFQQLPKLPNLLSKLERNVLPNMDFFEESMQETIQKAEEIGLHHQEAYHHQLFTLTNCSVTGLLSIVTGLLSFAAIRRGLTPCKLFRCCFGGRRHHKRAALPSRLFSEENSNQKGPETAVQISVVPTTVDLRETTRPSLPPPPPPLSPPPPPPSLPVSTPSVSPKVLSEAAEKLKKTAKLSSQSPPSQSKPVRNSNFSEREKIRVNWSTIN